jgi:CDP-glycerol glycerophosphotransferase
MGISKVKNDLMRGKNGKVKNMKAKLKAFVKSNHAVYLAYYYIGSLLLHILGLFIKMQPNQVLFVSYGGQKYDDSPRVIYEYLLEHPLPEKHKYIWAFNHPEEFPEVENSIKIDTLKYYIVALQSAYWITNSSAARGLNFKKTNTKNYFFTHGMTGIKKIGADIEQTKGIFERNFKEERTAIFIEGKFETEILVHAWRYPREIFINTGLPRNDDLVTVTSEEIAIIREKLGIPTNKKVILYTPTFREQSRDASYSNTLKIPFDFKQWEREFGREYVLLLTAHYEVAKLLGEIPQNDFVVNAFKYPILNDLLKVADIMISDYSSVVFDYAILERPVFCYGYDYDTYIVQRGVYTDLEELFSHGVLRTEDAMISAIKNIDYEKECQFTKRNIKEKYLANYGDAAKRAVEVIFKK